MPRSHTRMWCVGSMVCLAILGAVPRTAWAAPPEEGRALFTGKRPFRNGGPPCAACHSAAGLEFPGGGTLGPDLTTAFSNLGPQGVSAALQTLYFPTMSAIFATRPLAPDEQAALTAFFQEESTRPQSGTPTGGIVLIAAVGFAVALIATAFRGRGRVRGVRAALVEAAHVERRLP